MIKYTKCNQGFGTFGIIIAVVVLILFAGGGLYWNGVKKSNSLLQIGIEAEKKAQELKVRIESENKQVVSNGEIDTSNCS